MRPTCADACKSGKSPHRVKSKTSREEPVCPQLRSRRNGPKCKKSETGKDKSMAAQPNEETENAEHTGLRADTDSSGCKKSSANKAKPT